VTVSRPGGGGITDSEIVRAITISEKFVTEFGDWIEEEKQESGSAPDIAFKAIEAAVAAYDKADFATALQLIRPLADQGVAHAQSLLGGMYY
jgi:hypothetical protein